MTLRTRMIRCALVGLSLWVLCVLSACDPGSDAEAIGPLDRDHSEDRDVQAAIDACWLRHEAARNNVVTFDEPTHVVDCRDQATCRIELERTRDPRHAVNVFIRVDGVPVAQHPDSPTVEVEAVHLDSGEVRRAQPRATSQLGWRLNPGRYDLRARFSNPACDQRPAGHRTIADDVVIDEPRLFEVDLSTTAVQVVGHLTFDDVEDAEHRRRFDRSLWVISLLPTREQQSSAVPRSARSTITEGGTFELRALPGIYDVYLTYLAGYERPDIACGDLAFRHSQRIAQDVRIEEGAPIELSARPLLVSIRPTWVNGPLDRRPERLTLRMLRGSLAALFDAEDPLKYDVDVGETVDTVLWPGRYSVWISQWDSSVDTTHTLDVDASGAYELPIGRFPIRATLTLPWGLDELESNEEPRLSLRSSLRTLSPWFNTYLLAGTRLGDRTFGYAGLAGIDSYRPVIEWRLADVLHEDEDASLLAGELHLPTTGRIEQTTRLEHVDLPEVVPIELDVAPHDGELSRRRLHLVDAGRGLVHRHFIPRRWRTDDSRWLAYAGVYDLYWVLDADERSDRPSVGWRLASCQAIERPSTELHVRPEWRAVTIAPHLERFELDPSWTVSYRLLHRPGDRPWDAPVDVRVDSGLEHTLHLLPGTYEIGVESRRLARPLTAILEVR